MISHVASLHTRPGNSSTSKIFEGSRINSRVEARCRNFHNSETTGSRSIKVTFFGCQAAGIRQTPQLTRLIAASYDR